MMVMILCTKRVSEFMAVVGYQGVLVGINLECLLYTGIDIFISEEL